MKTTANPTTTPTPFVGWLRLPGGRWREVARGDNHADVSKAVDDHIAGLDDVRHCETYVGRNAPPMPRG